MTCQEPNNKTEIDKIEAIGPAATKDQVVRGLAVAEAVVMEEVETEAMELEVVAPGEVHLPALGQLVHLLNNGEDQLVTEVEAAMVEAMEALVVGILVEPHPQQQVAGVRPQLALNKDNGLKEEQPRLVVGAGAQEVVVLGPTMLLPVDGEVPTQEEEELLHHQPANGVHQQEEVNGLARREPAMVPQLELNASESKESYNTCWLSRL